MSIPSGAQPLPVPYVSLGGDSSSTGGVASRFDTCRRNIYSVASRFFSRSRELVFTVYYRVTGLIVNHQDTLSKAVERGDTTTVKAILYYNSWWSGLSCFPRDTPEMFYKAAANGDADMITVLKERSICIFVDRVITKAVFLAAEAGDAAATEMLLKNASVSDDHKEKALWKAAKNGHYDVVKILTQNPSEKLRGIFDTMLEISFIARKFDCLRTLIGGAWRKIDGGTRYTLPCNVGGLLDLAAIRGDIQDVTYILKYLETSQEERNKALSSAVCWGNIEVIGELLPASGPIKDEFLCHAINKNRTRHRTFSGCRSEKPPYPLNFPLITIALKKGSKLLAFRVHVARELVDCRKFYNDKRLGNAVHLNSFKGSWPVILDRILYGVQKRWDESKREGLLYN
jgi:hypothetical protein